MKPFLLFILTACYAVSVNAASPATEDTIKITNPHYSSDFEKKYMEEYLQTKKPNLLALLLATKETATEFELKKTKEDIDALIKSLDGKVLKEDDVAKKVKYLFATVHGKMFTKYETIAYFDQIFSNGVYNCLTGSALYALLFDNYNIRYKIMEKPQHVYILADPDDKNIIVESTDPTKGYYIPDEKFKKNYVDYLVTSKLVSKDELNNGGYAAIFDKNYYSDGSINLLQLAGLQYYNSSVENFNNQNYQSALFQIEKAYLLYPCEKNKFLLSQCALATLVGKDYSDINDIDLFIKAFNYSKAEDKDPFVAEFETMTHRFLIDKDKKDYYDEIFNKLSANITDSTFNFRISKIYYKESARAYYLKGMYDKALDNIIIAYSKNPENVETKAMLAELVSDQIKNYNDFQKVIDKLDQYVAKYPYMKDNAYFIQTYGNCYLLMAGSYFEANNEKLGLKYIKQFEELAAKKDYSLNEQLIGITYSEAWAYYVRKTQRDYAKQFIIRGLKYAPYNTDLQHKKRISEEAGN